MPWIYTPEIVYWMEGRRIALRLQAEGMELDLDQVNFGELGRASLGPSPLWLDREPTLDPEAREILARIVEERSRRHGQHQDQAKVLDRDPGQGEDPSPNPAPDPDIVRDTAPDCSTTDTPNLDECPKTDKHDQGHPRRATRARPGKQSRTIVT